MRYVLILTATVLLAFLAGCRGSEPTAGKLTVVATTTQVADLVRNVAGSDVVVKQILPPNADPHEYEPRPSDVEALSDAKLVFRSGGDLDEWLQGLTESAGAGGRSVDLSKSVTLRRPAGKLDPHWWQDPTNAIKAVASVRDQLIKVDPARRAVYQTNAAGYTRQLRSLDRAIARCVGRISTKQRQFVTDHDALSYFADRYDIKLVGTVIPSLSTQAEPSSRAVSRLVSLIDVEDVKAIFPERSLNTKLAQAIARESGAQVGRALWADTLGPKGSSGATYVGSLRANAQAIVDGLSGRQIDCHL